MALWTWLSGTDPKFWLVLSVFLLGGCRRPWTRRDRWPTSRQQRAFFHPNHRLRWKWWWKSHLVKLPRWTLQHIPLKFIGPSIWTYTHLPLLTWMFEFSSWCLWLTVGWDFTHTMALFNRTEVRVNIKHSAINDWNETIIQWFYLSLERWTLLFDGICQVCVWWSCFKKNLI